MNDQILKAMQSSNNLGKILIAFMVIFAITIGAMQANNNAIFKEFVKQGNTIEKLVKNQEQIGELKKCVNAEYKDAEKEFNSMLDILGKTLQKNNVVFPQELNQSIKDFRIEFAEVNTCLITIPEGN